MTLQERFSAIFPEPRRRGLQSEIARVCGVTQASVSAWFNQPDKAQTIDRANAEKIREHFGLDFAPAWLAEGLAERPNTEPGPDIRGKGRYPLISFVQAGDWTALCDNFHPGDAESHQVTHHNLGEHGYVLRVKGDSMKAPGERYSFPEGMLLFINPDKEPLAGQFVIVRREKEKEATFKRLTMVDGELFLEAINPEWPRRYLKLEEGDHFCGVVVDASFGNLP